MPLGTILFTVPESGADAALGCAGMRTRGIELADDGRLGSLGCIQAGHETRAACADNHYFEFMSIHYRRPISM